jgi:hypothetical protein
MAYVEEEILEEPIQVPPESLLFTFLDDMQSPSHNPASTSAPTTMEGATCIIEEEFPGEFLHMDSIASIQDTDDPVGTTMEEVKAVEVVDTGTTVEEVKVVEVVDTALEDLGAEVEGHPVLAPPPLTALPDLCHAPPPFFNLEQLELIFELRSQMADQIHRDTLMHQWIDMLYDAFSNAPETQCCPTCARPFVLQPRDGPSTGALDDMPPGANV